LVLMASMVLSIQLETKAPTAERNVFTLSF